jgi:hypothetical protein
MEFVVEGLERGMARFCAPPLLTPERGMARTKTKEGRILRKEGRTKRTGIKEGRKEERVLGKEGTNEKTKEGSNKGYQGRKK